MSATGRGAVRRENDFYETPDSAIDGMLPFIPEWCTSFLDPCAGNGVLLRRMVGERRGFEVDRLRADRMGYVQMDALASGEGLSWRVSDSKYCVVMNPPFSLAEEFCDRAIWETRAHGAGRIHDGTVIALMRLSMLASRRREPFWERYNRCDVHVLAARPSFTGGGTDAYDYAWFVWGPSATGRWSRIEAAKKRDSDGARS